MMEADIATWRSKLLLLRSLPKPKKQSRKSDTNSRSRERQKKVFEFSLDSGTEAVSIPKQTQRVKFSRARHDQYSSQSTQSDNKNNFTQGGLEQYDLFSFNDYVNPTISAERRFDMYLAEWRERKNVKTFSERHKPHSSQTEETTQTGVLNNFNCNQIFLVIGPPEALQFIVAKEDSSNTTEASVSVSVPESSVAVSRDPRHHHPIVMSRFNKEAQQWTLPRIYSETDTIRVGFRGFHTSR